MMYNPSPLPLIRQPVPRAIGYIPDEELELLRKGVNSAKEAVIEILKNNIDSAMNKYNFSKKKDV